MDLFTRGAEDLIAFADGAMLLRGFALDAAPTLAAGVDAVTRAAPLRRMTVPGGLQMSVAMTNCGRLGWVSDARGYRYDSDDPVSGRPWPVMPHAFRALAVVAAAAAGFERFDPDACLVNRYEPGAKLSLHRDADERDFSQPIVSVSLGLPATFLFGGLRRADPTLRMALEHGDVVVWGGAARKRYHGVAALKAGGSPGAHRINLTFRNAG